MECLETRSELLRIAQQMHRLGLVTLTAGNVSARDRDTGLLLITPSAVAYETMTVEDIVVCRTDGTVVAGRWLPSSEWPMHSAVLRARPDLGAVVHTHSPYALALAAAAQRIPPICLEVLQCGGNSIEVAPWAIPGSPELGQAALSCLTGGRKATLLQHHGLLATGVTLDEALYVAVKAEEAARTYMLASQVGSPVPLTQAQIDALQAYSARQAAARAAQTATRDEA